MNGDMSDVTPEMSVESGDAVPSFKPFGNSVVQKNVGMDLSCEQAVHSIQNERMY